MNFRRLTVPPKHHFFGYYDKFQCNKSASLLLSHQVSFSNRPLQHSDNAVLGTIDQNCHNFEPFAKTTAWNFQQGSMLQWHPASPENTVIYNDRRENQFVTVVFDLSDGKEKKVLTLPIAAVSHCGTMGLSLNFSRLAQLRPGYGYEGIADKFENSNADQNDGIYLIDMETGKYQMILNLAQMATYSGNLDIENTKHWFNHLLFSPDNKRFIFLHRWSQGKGHQTRMYTANTDGTDIYLLNDNHMNSHFDWRDNNHIISFARNSHGDGYYLFEDKTDNVEVIGGEKLSPLYDGHCSYSPDRKWILTDTYPDKEQKRQLLLYNPQSDELISLGKFHSQNRDNPALRCDLHPRWDRTGKKIFFDSTHEESRQIYSLDVSQIVT